VLYAAVGPLLACWLAGWLALLSLYSHPKGQLAVNGVLKASQGQGDARAAR
jgi:hypothetical protein